MQIDFKRVRRYRGGMHGRRSLLLAATIVFVGSCTERRLPEHRDLEDLCETWCPLVFSCPNVWKGDYADVEECMMDCNDPESILLQEDSCGTVHWDFVTCMASLDCEALLLRQETDVFDANHPCREEEIAISRDCP